MKICKNCAKEFKGKYCPRCSQKATISRITTRDLFQDVLKKYLPFDKGFLYTAWHVITRPGLMVRDYLDGKRVDYTKPLSFLVLLIAASIIFLPQAEFQQKMQAGMSISNPSAKTAMMEEISQWVYTHLTVIIAGMLPFTALSSKWLHRKHDVNYAEHLVLNVYLMAGCTLVSLPVSIIAYVLGLSQMDFGQWSTVLNYTLFFAYFVWGNIQFFQPASKILEVVKAILTYLIGYLLYIIAVGIVTIPVMIVYKMVFQK